MAKVFIEESNLTAIGDAIRAKTGKSELLNPVVMPTEIEAIQTGGGEYEPVLLTGSCYFTCSGSTWNQFFPLISTKDITDASNMFISNPIDRIPFTINLAKNCTGVGNIFSGCNNLTVCPTVIGNVNAPTGDYSGALDINSIFSSCYRLREIPSDFFTKMFGEAFCEASKNYGRNRSQIFNDCRSLRRLPDLQPLKHTTSYYWENLYYSMCPSCYVLDEITNVPVLDTCTFIDNAFQSTFYYNHRAKDITFETNADGSPKTANWSNQTIDLSNKIGYANGDSNILNWNSGLTYATQIYSDANYQELKDNPDSWTLNEGYSRYNHDSAVNTINSLPDVSSGSGNTIKFRGTAGSRTDGGAINTLTEEEIAVAASKGWTVSFAQEEIMKAIDYKLTRYDADEGKVFDWKEPRFVKNSEGEEVQEHLYATTLFIGSNDSIDNYVEVEAPVIEEVQTYGNIKVQKRR